jgi:RNA polymerase sigma-70 factor (ECF subfamily)
MEAQVTSSEPDRTEEFLALLNEYEKKLNAYVFALVKDVPMGEDILQETRLMLWKHFDQYIPNTNFLAWAKKMAFHQILSHRRKAKRHPTCLSEEILTSIADDMESFEEDKRADALKQCLKKLTESHQKIINMRYFDNLDIEAISKVVDRPEGGVYRVLSRIRSGLNKCIKQNISGGVA